MSHQGPGNNSHYQTDAIHLHHKVLLELSQAGPDELNDGFTFFTEKIAEVVKADRISIWTYQQDQRTLTCEDLFTSGSRNHMAGTVLRANDFPTYFSVLEQSRCIDAIDARSDERTSEFTENYLIPENIHSLLDVPIRYDGRLAGVLCCETTGGIKDWTTEEKEFSTSAAEILSTCIQTAQRKKVEEALIQSEIKYQKIVDNAIIGIYHSNLAGQILFANQSMVEMFEFPTLDDAMRYSIMDLYSDLADRHAFVSKLAKEKVLRNYELPLVTRLGNPRIVLINAFLENDMIIGMVTDITDRKKDMEEIKAAMVRAEESDRLKTSLMANMSHEFRTPMNAILGFSDLISNESNDPDIVFFARKINSSGKRLMATLKAILDLADLEATRSKIKINDINIQDTISGLLQPFYPVANDKDLSLITEFKDGLYAKADENLLHIILQNLIDNAIKFTNKGGITIETDLTTEDGTLWSLIHIKDTGIGIPSEKFEIIFHEFRQLSEGHNRSYEGTGLGLTLARKMIELINGKISLESEVGLGSIFTVWLPAGTNTCRPASLAMPKIQENIHQSRIFKLNPPEELPLILVVEDNDDNAEIVKLYLRGQYKTERAHDAVSALKMAKVQQFSGILMDINLGSGNDGLKATQDIRKIAGYENVPIIAITGYTMSGDREKLLQGGCSHYLGKPFSQQGLLELMSEIFE